MRALSAVTETESDSSVMECTRVSSTSSTSEGNRTNSLKGPGGGGGGGGSLHDTLFLAERATCDAILHRPIGYQPTMLRNLTHHKDIVDVIVTYTTVYYGIHKHSECIPVDCGVTNLIHDRRSCVDFTLEVDANVTRCVHSSVNKPCVKRNSGLRDV